MTEEWLPVTIPGCSSYSVSSKSNIRNKHGVIMKPSRQGNITLCGTLGKVREYVYRVSCMAFHGARPSPTHTVDHIDRIWTNNDVGNLRWASKSLQMKNKKYPKSKGFQVIYETSENTIYFKSVAAAARNFSRFRNKKTTLHLWLKRDGIVKVNGGTLKYDKLLPKKDSIIKTIPSWIIKDNKDVVVKVSSCGLVSKSGSWTTGHKSGRPFKYFVKGVGESNFLVHRLIAATFLGKPDDPERIYVNHIDGNGFNNRIENLEWVSPSGNNVHAVETGLHKLTPVVQYSLEGTRMKDFSSVNSAARYVDGENSHISAVCKGKNKSAYNFMWKYKSEAPEQINPISRGSARKEIRQYDLDGNLMEIYVSGRDAAKKLGTSPPQITHACQGKKSLGDFTLKIIQ